MIEQQQEPMMTCERFGDPFGDKWGPQKSRDSSLKKAETIFLASLSSEVSILYVHVS